MLARGLRFIIACELVLYVLIGYWLVTKQYAGLWAATGIMVAVALGVRAFVIAVTFVAARIYRSPVPPAKRLGPLAATRMVLEEYVAFILVFTIVQPFERFFMREDKMGLVAKGRLPVLLVHGYECNRGFWWRIRPRLEAAGWTVATLSLEPVFAGIDEYADAIARRIAEVCEATGAGQVILVAHSMGGLASRAYVRRHGSGRVARLVTLGSPHHGSRLAVLGMGENARQMVPGSAWLNELNQPHVCPLPKDTVSLYSYHDNYVMPQASSVLPGARNIGVAGVGHLAMAINSRFLKEVLAELERRPGEKGGKQRALRAANPATSPATDSGWGRTP